MLQGLSFLLALACALAMGLAIQRGATCTVAAVDELLRTGRPAKTLALLEAALWVGAGLLLARQLGHVMALPAGVAVSTWTVLGAALLGLGAVVNQACVLGTVARLGNGQWAYAATPLGFYLGCLSVPAVFNPPAAQRLAGASPAQAAPAWLAWVLLGLFVVRCAAGLWRNRGRLGAAWSPHSATAAIGVAFALLVGLAGAWSYSDVLADLARGMPAELPSRAALGAALLAGAVLGGYWHRQPTRHPLRAQQLLRCAAGGVMMGWGSVLTPGSNDSLALLGLPLLWPHAWVGVAVMAATVAAMLTVQRGLHRRAQTQRARSGVN